MIAVLGVHHVKVPVTDLGLSRAWYETILPLTAHLEFKDEEGALRGVVYQPLGGLTLCLREDPDLARALSGFDPFAILVQSEAELRAFAERLDSAGVGHGPIVTATLGWLLSVPDPDGLSLRFYTADRHREAITGPGHGIDVSDPAPSERDR